MHTLEKRQHWDASKALGLVKEFVKVPRGNHLLIAEKMSSKVELFGDKK